MSRRAGRASNTSTGIATNSTRNAGRNSGAPDGNNVLENTNGNAIEGTTEFAANDAFTTAGNAFTDHVGSNTGQSTDTGTVRRSDNIDPATGKRRYTRRTTSTTEAKPVDINGVEKTLLAIHSSLAALVGVPELEMNTPEAQKLAEAYRDVAEYYPAVKLPAHVQVLVTFFGVSATIYGAKFMAYRMRRQMEKPQRPTMPSQSPVDFNAARDAVKQNATPTAVNGVDTGNKGPRIVPREMRTAEIAPGLMVELPPDHPLVSGRGGNG